MTSRLVVLVFLLLPAVVVAALPVNCEDSAEGCNTAKDTRTSRDRRTLPRHSLTHNQLHGSASPMLVDGNISDQDELSRMIPRKYPGIHIHPSSAILGCDNKPTGKLGFCYWAIETGTADMILYSNRHSSALIEQNIKQFCEPPESDEGVYGLAFVDKHIAKKYVNAYESDSLVNDNNQHILTDVFFFCCSTKKGCANYSKADPFKVENMLADELLDFAWTYMSKGDDSGKQQRRRPGREPVECMLYDGTIIRIPGTRMCVLILDASSTTTIYGGPPIFNYIDMEQQSRALENDSIAAAVSRRNFCQPLRRTSRHMTFGDRCYKYLSNKEYILICCCYEEPRKCSLKSGRRAYSRIRSWSSKLAQQVEMVTKSEEQENDDYFNWVKISYMLATPQVHQKSGYKERSEEYTKSLDSLKEDYFDERIRYVHCVEGSFIVRGIGADHGKNRSLWRHEMSPPAEHCVTNLTITYASEDYINITRVAANVGTGDADMCYHGDRCTLTGPQCFNDLIDKREVNATLTCCCRNEHMCNHKVKAGDSAMAILRSSGAVSWCASGAVSSIIEALKKNYKDFVLCARLFTFDDAKELFYLEGITHYSLTPLGVYTIKGLVEDPSKNGTCERTISFPIRDQFCDERRREILFPVQFIRCLCTTKRSVSCDEDFQEKALNISVNASSLLPKCMGGLTTVNILFDGRAIYKYETYSTVTTHWPVCENTVEFFYKKRQFYIRSGPYSANSTLHNKFTIAWNVSSHKCFAKLGRPPCNGRKALLRLISNYEKYYASQKTRKKGSQCPGDKTDKAQPCRSHTGCFTFHAMDGSLLKRGCMDQIDEIIQRDKTLEFLGFCKSRTVLAEIERGPEWKAYYCSGVTHFIDDLEFKEGVLCCCPSKCPNDTLKFFHFL